MVLDGLKRDHFGGGGSMDPKVRHPRVLPAVRLRDPLALNDGILVFTGHLLGLFCLGVSSSSPGSSAISEVGKRFHPGSPGDPQTV